MAVGKAKAVGRVAGMVEAAASAGRAVGEVVEAEEARGRIDSRSQRNRCPARRRSKSIRHHRRRTSRPRHIVPHRRIRRCKCSQAAPRVARALAVEVDLAMAAEEWEARVAAMARAVEETVVAREAAEAWAVEAWAATAAALEAGVRKEPSRPRRVGCGRRSCPSPGRRQCILPRCSLYEVERRIECPWMPGRWSAPSGQSDCH